MNCFVKFSSLWSVQKIHERKVIFSFKSLFCQLKRTALRVSCECENKMVALILGISNDLVFLLCIQKFKEKKIKSNSKRNFMFSKRVCVIVCVCVKLLNSSIYLWPPSMCVYAINRKLNKLNFTSICNRCQFDDSVQRNLQVRQFVSWFVQEIRKNTSKDSLVRHDKHVSLSLKLHHNRL